MKMLYLEGTESILLNIPKDKKELILKAFSEQKMNAPKIIFGDLIRYVKYLLNTDIITAKNVLVEITTFYKNNIPNGWTRVKDAWDLVNTNGELLRFNRRVVDPNNNISHKGYAIIKTHPKTGGEKTISLHRIIAETFIPNLMEKPQVNHIDGNKLNNTVENLEWVSNLENIQHSWKLGLRDTERMKQVGKGTRNSQAILTEEDIKEIRKTHSELENNLVTSIAKNFSTTMDSIRDILTYKVKENIPRYKLPVARTTSKNISKTYTYNKWCCKESNSYIRGFYLKSIFNNNIKLASKYNVSVATIRDIIARRSWDYDTL